MAHKTVAIIQSNYIPWKGYFDVIAAVDEFIVFDEVQYTRRDWRNRNKIKAQHGLTWLTIPVMTKGNYLQKIRDVRIDGSAWKQEHLLRMRHAYASTAHFHEQFPWLEELYANSTTEFLTEVNVGFLRAICERLGIKTPITSSSDYEIVPGKSERLLHICRQAGADAYLSGPAARDYIDEPMFASAGVAVEFVNYEGYRAYDQPYPPFEHGVSIVDLILCTGSQAASYMKFGSAA